MRVLHLNTLDSVGGAARAVSRLHGGLQRLGITSRLLVREKTSEDPDVLVAALKRWLASGEIGGPLRSFLGRFIWRNVDIPPRFSVPVEGLCSRDIKSTITSFAPDVIHCHWICSDFVSFSDLADLPIPLVWTLHDSWPFTGGCHVPGACRKYEDSCGACEMLESGVKNDLSRWIMKVKEARYGKMDITLVAPSRWLAERASASRLFRNRQVEIIPNGLDTEVYRPIAKDVARRMLGLPRDRKIIAFGAIDAMADPNKGYPQLLESLANLPMAPVRNEVHLLTFGTDRDRCHFDVELAATHLGRLHDDVSLVTAYSAADVMVVPSLQEAFGQTASEAMSCGTPVVAFDGSGLSDVVDHCINGYLARPQSVEDLARGIRWVLERVDTGLSIEARKKAENSFSLETVSRRYISLYQNLLEAKAK